MRFADAHLDIEDVERLLRHLDQLWASLVQLVDYLIPGNTPVTRSQVPRPTVVQPGLNPPHDIILADSDPPANDEVWRLYRRVLVDPAVVASWLPQQVGDAQQTWDVAQRAQRDDALTAAFSPTGARLTGGGEPIAPRLRCAAVERLLRRIQLHAERISGIAGRAVCSHSPE